jgi:hypothetical protein
MRRGRLSLAEAEEIFGPEKIGALFPRPAPQSHGRVKEAETILALALAGHPPRIRSEIIRRIRRETVLWDENHDLRERLK